MRQMDNTTLNGEWEVLRKGLLNACGLRDLQSSRLVRKVHDALFVLHLPVYNDVVCLHVGLFISCSQYNIIYLRPGSGYTGHCFNDFNHVDCCTMQGAESHNENLGQVDGIAYSNQLGPGITVASKVLGQGDAGSGSWCTCQIGAHKSPPADVCHRQFKAQVSFKLVWCPGDFTTFTVVDDAGGLLAHGSPSGLLPGSREREANWRAVKGSKYAVPCTQILSEHQE